MFVKGIIAVLALTFTASAQAKSTEILVKLAAPISTQSLSTQMESAGFSAKPVFGQWVKIDTSSAKNAWAQNRLQSFLSSASVVYVQPNYKLDIFRNPTLNKLRTQKFATLEDNKDKPKDPRDNPAFPSVPSLTPGKDPQSAKQWGMADVGVEAAWKISVGAPIIVAVIDTGVDYTHEDLAGQMWHNEKEIDGDGIDNDGNGYIDDIVGWDTLSHDNKPYDLAATSLTDILNGANPGHGTHCTGTIGAAVNNSKGVISIAPNTKIMALRFIGDEGGSTAGAVEAIKYAVDNGAKILSNSWGSEGEDSEDPNDSKILKEAIQYALDHDVLFVAAAGNSSRNNDTDKLKAFPASYEHDNIIAVAAINSSNQIASFSNFGAKSVDLGAPGVKIMSTVPGNRYQDSISEILGANWDGTSMAAPYVAGAAALYWSSHPTLTYKEVKAALLSSVKPIPSLAGKTLTGGKLSVEELMKKQSFEDYLILLAPEEGTKFLHIP